MITGSAGGDRQGGSGGLPEVGESVGEGVGESVGVAVVDVVGPLVVDAVDVVAVDVVVGTTDVGSGPPGGPGPGSGELQVSVPDPCRVPLTHSSPPPMRCSRAVRVTIRTPPTPAASSPYSTAEAPRSRRGTGRETC
jgi:hypothetical protein